MKSGLGQLTSTSQLGTEAKLFPFEILSETMFSVPALCWGLFLHDGLLLRRFPPRVAHRDFCLGCGLVWVLRLGVLEVVLFIWRRGQPKWALQSGTDP